MSAHKPRRKKKKASLNNMLIFLMAFIIFLVVFGGICLWAVVKINDEQRQTVSSSQSSATDEVEFTESDARNLLIVTVDDNAQPQGFVVVRANPVSISVRVMAIPRDTVVDYKTSEMRLYELYNAQGIVVARDSLSALTGLTFDNYAVITYANMEKLIDYFEAGVIMTLNEDLNYSGEGLLIRMDSGTHTLGAKQAVNVLRYPAWKAGRLQRADIQAQMTAAFINQYMRSSRESMADADFSAMVNYCQRTDILRSHYNNAKDMLAYLAKANKGGLGSTLSLNGTLQGSGDAIRYYASDNIKQIIASDFM